MDIKRAAKILLTGFVLVLLGIIFNPITFKLILLLTGMITVIIGTLEFQINSEVNIGYSIIAFFIGLIVSIISFFFYSLDFFKDFFIVVFIIGVVVAVGGTVFTIMLIYKALTASAGEPHYDKNAASFKDSNTINKSSSMQKAVSTDDSDEKKVEYNLLDTITDENKLKYEYEKEMFVTEEGWQNISGNLGNVLRFIKEPDNQYDENAIAIYAGKNKIGYVYKGKNQDMINDWINNGKYLSGYLSRYSLSEKKASYRIGFYASLLPYPNKIFSLIKTGKKIDEFSKRSDNISMCNKGDAISAELDVESFSYTVYNDMYEEIGELPKSANNFLNSNDFDEIVGTIEEIDYDYDSAPKIKVKIYLLKDWK